ncbi:MAG: hypothetical protein ACOY0T_16195 [Myxococcota bacterium]
MRLTARRLLSLARHARFDSTPERALAALLACACASPTPPASTLPTASSQSATPIPTATPTPPPDTHGVKLEALPAAPLPAVLPRVEVLEPAFGDVLDARLARTARVRLRVENSALSADREGVLVALDGMRPRRWLAERPLVLGDLWPADAEIAPGLHSLLAIAVAADGRVLRGEANGKRPLSLVQFFVGARPEGATPASASSVFCLGPVGTVYAKQGTPMLFEALWFGQQKPPASVLVRTQQHSFALPFDSERVYSISGLPLGDTWLRVGEPGGASSECVVTLNPPVEGSP